MRNSTSRFMRMDGPAESIFIGWKMRGVVWSESG
jgi:hypothetical protein